METAHPTYQDRITTDPQVMVGKPVVRGTRVPVETVLRTLAQNPDLGELFADYPHLTLDDVRACLAYAEALVAGEEVTPAPKRRHGGTRAAQPAP